MKKIVIKSNLILLLFLTALNCATAATAHFNRMESLKGRWKFSLGDNMKFANPDYDDSKWEEIDVPSSWESEGFRDYDGYAWYRRKIQADLTSGNNVYLHLGKIDDVDEVYFNGHKIGSSGSFPPQFVSAFSKERVYAVPKDYIKKWNNVIAVRVYDQFGQGGFMSSNVGVYDHDDNTEGTLLITGLWKFHLFDQPVWSQPSFNDSDWEDIMVPGHWESQGFSNYDGIAWYRKTIMVPSHMRSSEMMLILGKIDDKDEVFLNGVKIGGTGDFNEPWKSYGQHDEWSKKRNYFIPDGLLKPGKENVIAVRVYDHHSGGGIYEGPQAIIRVSDYRAFWEHRHHGKFDDIDEIRNIRDVLEIIDRIFD